MEKFKIKIKKYLSLIPYTKIYICLAIIFCIGILGQNTIGGILFDIMFLISFIVSLGVVLLEAILCAIDEIKNIGMVVLIIIWVFIVITCIGKIILYFIPILFPKESVDTMINLFSNCFSSLISASMGILGVFLGSSQQKNYEKRIRLKEVQHKEQSLEKLYNAFIKQEITYNFSNVLPRELKGYLLDQCKPFTTCGYDDQKFIFQEFDAVKSEIISIDCRISQEILEIYSMFKILQCNEKIINLTQEQYDFIKEVYLKNVDNYNKTEI